MKQSRFMSIVESLTNTFVGFWIGVASQTVVYWALGIDASFHQEVIIAVALTFVSVARSYLLRRLFEAIRIQQGKP